MRPLFTRKLFKEVYIPLAIVYCPFPLVLWHWLGVDLRFKVTFLTLNFNAVMEASLAFALAVLTRIIWVRITQKSVTRDNIKLK